MGEITRGWTTQAPGACLGDEMAFVLLSYHRLNTQDQWGEAGEGGEIACDKLVGVHSRGGGSGLAAEDEVELFRAQVDSSQGG